MCAENVELTLEIWGTVVEKIGYKIGQDSLLEHPAFVILERYEACLDMLHMKFVLTWNAHAAPFYLKRISQA